MPSSEDLATLRRLRREQHLADLRDGRRRRATRIEPARYQRRPKHRNRPPD